MQQIYLKRMTKQDITRSVTICTESVDRFWGVSREETSEYMPIKICSENNPTYFPHDITIHKGYQGEKDWRITGSGFKKLYANDEPQELDIMCVKKTNLGNFVLSIIKHDSPAYNILKSFFKGNDNYAIIDVDDEQAETESIHNEKQSLQIIYYGAPGTGKSHKIKSEVDEKNKICYRTTFHPDSDYSTFVGAYKPSMKPTGTILASGEKEEIIKYTFVPQAFTKAYVHAWNTKDEVYLVIEEINRGNCAQIFGDLFQLLDRKNGFSEYPIDADSDLEDHIKEKLETSTRDDIPEQVRAGKKLMLPSNLYIWATMNTSDQSLFPIDSAFKRRWDWEYVPIEYGQKKSNNEDNDSYNFIIKIGGNKYKWIKFLRKVNDKIYDTTLSEDKQMGNYFIKGDVDELQFVNKVMFYLWNEVCKEEYKTQRNFFRKGKAKDNEECQEFKFVDLFTAEEGKDLEQTRADILTQFMVHLEVNPESKGENSEPKNNEQPAEQ